MQPGTQRVVDWDSLHVGLLFCYEGPVPEAGLGMKRNPGATAWLVRHGWAQVTDESRDRVRANAGQWLMVRPGLRMQEFSPDARLLSINFRAAFHTGESLFIDGLSRILEPSDHPALERAAKSLIRKASPLLGPWTAVGALTAPVTLSAYLKLQSAVLDWVLVWSEALVKSGCVPSAGYTSDPRVARGLAYLRGHIRELELDGNRLAAELGLSLSQLNRLFIQERSETLRNVHQRQRSEHAQHLLVRSAYSIKEVALDLGFRHASHFTAWFRKQTGMNPTQFRLNPIRNRFHPPPALRQMSADAEGGTAERPKAKKRSGLRAKGSEERVSG